MRDNDRTYKTACAFGHETDKAIKITIDDEEHWIPLSQIVSMDRRRDDTGFIVMTEWIAIQKGII